MIKIVSVQQMQTIEATADANGIPYDTLFERVALAVTERVWHHISGLQGPRVAILVGSGNNGGDGLVTAVQLAQAKPDLQIGVYLVKPREADDSQLQAVRDADIFIAEAENDQQYRVLRNMVASANVVIDAIFGIGVRLPLKGDITKIMRNVNQALRPPAIAPVEGVLIDPTTQTPVTREARQVVISMDCPSGVNCDTGEVDKLAIKADETITFIAVKQGLLLPAAADHTGDLLVATLGIPEDQDDLKAIELGYADSALVQSMLPKRPTSGHKGTFGKVMIAAGSVNYTGAAGLAAMAAYRSGAGLVTVAAPGPVVAGLASQMLEVTWVMLPHDMGVIGEKAADVLIEEITDYKALLIGPGIGQEDTTKDMLLSLFEQTRTTEKPRRPARAIGFSGVRKVDAETDDGKDDSDNDTITLPPLVLDADALNLLATVDNWWERLPKETIITPHPGEMARLCDIETTEVQANRLSLAREKAAEWHVVVVLKGAHTVIAAPDGRTVVLPYKTSALATAGTGDVLAGVIVSLRGQGLGAYEAAVAGSYVHGSAGTIAQVKAGNDHSVIAGDLLNTLGTALGQLTG